MKLIYSLLLLSAAHAATIDISPAANPVTVGVPFTLTVGINLDPGESLFAYQADVLFPFLQVQALQVNEAGYFAANGVFFGYSIDNATGLISFVSNSLSGVDQMSASGDLFSVDFLPILAGDGAVSLDSSTALFLDPTFATLAVTFNPATFTATVSVPEPSTFLLTALALGATLLRMRKP